MHRIRKPYEKVGTVQLTLYELLLGRVSQLGLSQFILARISLAAAGPRVTMAVSMRSTDLACNSSTEVKKNLRIITAGLTMCRGSQCQMTICNNLTS